MRVIDCETLKVCEIGLFVDPCWKYAINIRLLELPLVFGERGVVVGYLESWPNVDADDGISYSIDLDAIEFFELRDPVEDILDSPEGVLKSIIHLSPRFRTAPVADLGVT